MRLWLWNRRDRAADSPQLQTKLLGRHALSIYLQHGIQVWRVCALPGASGQCTAVPSISCWETPDKSAAPRRPLDCCRRSEAKGGGFKVNPREAPTQGTGRVPTFYTGADPAEGPSAAAAVLLIMVRVAQLPGHGTVREPHLDIRQVAPV